MLFDLRGDHENVWVKTRCQSAAVHMALKRQKAALAIDELNDEGYRRLDK